MQFEVIYPYFVIQHSNAIVVNSSTVWGRIWKMYSIQFTKSMQLLLKSN